MLLSRNESAVVVHKRLSSGRWYQKYGMGHRVSAVMSPTKVRCFCSNGWSFLVILPCTAFSLFFFSWYAVDRSSEIIKGFLIIYEVHFCTIGWVVSIWNDIHVSTRDVPIDFLLRFVFNSLKCWNLYLNNFRFRWLCRCCLVIVSSRDVAWDAEEIATTIFR